MKAARLLPLLLILYCVNLHAQSSLQSDLNDPRLTRIAHAKMDLIPRTHLEESDRCNEERAPAEITPDTTPVQRTHDSPLVVDKADVLTAACTARLTQKLTHLRDTTGIAFTVLTIPSLNRADIARQQMGDHAALLILATEDRATRLQFSNDLQAKLTDNNAGEILRTDTVPYLSYAQYNIGAAVTIDSLSALLDTPASPIKSSRHRNITALMVCIFAATISLALILSGRKR